MIRLVFDCLRSPYDYANIIQVVLAIGCDKCEIHVTGNSLCHNHPKIVGKVSSWSKKVKQQGLSELPIRYHETLETCITMLRSRGIRMVGTSPHASKTIHDFDLSDGNIAIVFGTETSGLTKTKVSMLDDMMVVPMSPDIDFMTLSVCVPIVAYEMLRQQHNSGVILWAGIL